LRVIGFLFDFFNIGTIAEIACIFCPIGDNWSFGAYGAKPSIGSRKKHAE